MTPQDVLRSWKVSSIDLDRQNLLKPWKRLTSAVTLLLCVLVSSCATLPETQTVKVKTVPLLPKVTLPAPIPQPSITMPEVITLTAQDASYYRYVCDEFKDAGRDDAYTLDEVYERYPGMTQESACNWAIYGYTVQGQFMLESQLIKLGLYTEQLRNRIQYLEGVIKELENAGNLQQQAFLEQDDD